MKLNELMDVINENTVVDVEDEYGYGELLNRYEARNSIPTSYNELEVNGISVRDGRLIIEVELSKFVVRGTVTLDVVIEVMAMSEDEALDRIRECVCVDTYHNQAEVTGMDDAIDSIDVELNDVEWDEAERV